MTGYYAAFSYVRKVKKFRDEIDGVRILVENKIIVKADARPEWVGRKHSEVYNEDVCKRSAACNLTELSTRQA